MTTTNNPSETQHHQLSAIKAVVASLQTAQQNEDVDRFIGLFTPTRPG